MRHILFVLTMLFLWLPINACSGPTSEEIMELGAFSVKNILTFNPGWNSEAQPLREFTDVRELQRQLKARGVNMISAADESSTGPTSFVIADPDGNTIMVDQHV
jgi:hypothetical protein